MEFYYTYLTNNIYPIHILEYYSFKNNFTENKKIYINEFGLYNLILNSKIKNIKEFEKLIILDVIPKIRKYGSYSTETKYEHKFFYDENLPIIFGYIGIYNNEHLFKFGKTNNIYERDYGKHKYKYDKFDIIYVVESDNKDYVEKRFKEELVVKNIYRTLQINGRNDKELFTITNNINIDDIKNILNMIVKNFKINKDHIIAEYEYQIETEKTKQLMIQSNFNLYNNNK